MSRHRLAVAVSAVALACLMLTPVSGQQRKAPSTEGPASPRTVPRAPDGHPDLQVVWTTQTFTPLERPKYLGDRAFYTEAEAAELVKQFSAEGVNPSARGAINIADPEERKKALVQSRGGSAYEDL